ncbi:hypothetical protein CERSUDRAFT_158908 [Gelatoporia subvermispora B]|uniref:Cytochrome P450 n=1 Tax=Ceriporiopsis subvermispora (strain B) TaxID=914234 RepID=M2R7Q2_CERS8|nr:hypothetical protein CERSUDRAFT_158908 [Gelatoporia subvermispora B]
MTVEATFSSESVLIGLSVLLVVLFYQFRHLSKRHASLPPGPPAHWFRGYAVSGSYVPRQFANLTQQYGPVFTVKQGRDTVVVIGRYEARNCAANEIMNKHAADLVDRPRQVAAGEILSGNMRVVVTGAGSYWRKLRKALHAMMQPKVAVTYEPAQMRNAKRYILDLLEDPEHHLEHGRRYAVSFIMELAYGKTTPTSYSDPVAKAINRAISHFADARSPGAFYVDRFPILRYIPLFASKLERWHNEELTLFKEQLATVKQQMAKGEAPPSFGTYLLQGQAELGLTDNEAAYLAGSMFGAGSHSTAATLGFVTMAAACFPDTQAKVQAQLDKVVGRDRLPTFADKQFLPEVEAFILEVFRWRPVSIMGVPHRSTRDIIWRDYVIPAGTTVLGCHWAIAHDEDVYPEPEKFDPRRWLDEKGELRKDVKFPAFGFGRRVCPGQEIAERSAFVNIALVLWAFNIARDPEKPIDTYAILDSTIAYPLPFSVKFEERITNVKDLIMSHQE